MSIYIILDNTIHDPKKYDDYMRAVPALSRRPPTANRDLQ